MHIDAQTLTAIGVGAHLLAALLKTVWKAPKRQAQVDAIERKVDEMLGELKGAAK